MAKSLKKLLSLTIAVIMVLSLIPAVSANEVATPVKATQDGWEPAPSGAVYAYDETIEVTDEASLIAALANRAGANDSQYDGKWVRVLLKNDITITTNASGTRLYVGHFVSDTENRAAKVVLDLGGNTLTDNANHNRLFGVYAGSEFVVTNGTILANGTYKLSGSIFLCHGNSKITLDGVHVQVKDNSHDTVDGGIFYGEGVGKELTVTNAKLEVLKGTVQNGGIIALKGDGELTITNSQLIGGNAAKNGGNIYIRIDSNANNAGVLSAYITDSVIAEGTAVGGSDMGGGNIYAYDSSKGYTNLTLKDSIVRDGVVTAANGWGGNIQYGSNNNEDSTKATRLILDGCTIENGDASDGYGGNLGISGNVTVVEIIGGTVIQNGTADAESDYTKYGGGNMYQGNKSVVVNLRDGSFLGGQAHLGGNIRGRGYINMYGGTLEGGTAAYGDLFQDADPLYVNVYGGTIRHTATTEDALEMSANGKIQIYNGTVDAFKTEGDAMLSYIAPCSTAAQTDANSPFVITHKDVEGATTTTATCTADGTKTIECATCGQTYTYADPAAHTWDEGKITTDPKCGEAGVKTYTCTVDGCGATETEPVDALEHNMKETTAAVAPTCETAGATAILTCANGCGKTEGGEPIPASDEYHVWGDEVYNEETKQFEKTCETCKETKGREPAEIQITAQPTLPETVTVGQTKQLSVAATGEGELTYLWQYSKDGTKWYWWTEPGEATTMEVLATAARTGYQFKCVVTNAYGKMVESEVATLNVVTEGVIVITAAPEAQSKKTGESATFSVTAESTVGATLTYLWQYSKDGTKWYYWAQPGEAASIEVPVVAHRQGYQFRCVITDNFGVEVETAPVALTVEQTLEAPAVTTDVENGQMSLSAEITDGGEYTYLWLYRRPTSAEGKWYYWQNPGKTAHTMSGAVKGRTGYNFVCEIKDAYGSVVRTAVYTLTAQGNLEVVNN